MSHVLACRRFKHSHTGEQIARAMGAIFDEFHIMSKITACITDNAANMAKAVRLLETEARSSEENSTNECDDAVNADVVDVETIPIHGMGIDESMTPLRQARLTGLQTRRRAVFADDQYHIASLLIPRFKINYLPKDEQHLKKLLLAQAISALDKRTTVTSAITHNDEQSVSQAASAS